MSNAALLYDNGSTIYTTHGIYSFKDEEYNFIKESSDTNRFNKIKTNFQNTTLVILDEKSTIRKTLLSKIDARLRQIRGIDLPFGGCDITICGDFLQLTPPRGGSLMFSFFDRDIMGDIMRYFVGYTLTGKNNGAKATLRKNLLWKI
jgi:PIF1-like helicase